MQAQSLPLSRANGCLNSCTYIASFNDHTNVHRVFTLTLEIRILPNSANQAKVCKWKIQEVQRRCDHTLYLLVVALILNLLHEYAKRKLTLMIWIDQCGRNK